MPHPVSIALRLRAFLLAGLLCWLMAAPQLAAAAPRATMVGPAGPQVAPKAWALAADALQEEFFTASDCGSLRLGLPGLALLPPAPGYALNAGRPAGTGCAHEVPELPELPTLRARLRASVSPNAP